MRREKPKQIAFVRARVPMRDTGAETLVVCAEQRIVQEG
jgi:hypothetical protein